MNALHPTSCALWMIFGPSFHFRFHFPCAICPFNTVQRCHHPTNCIYAQQTEQPNRMNILNFVVVYFFLWDKVVVWIRQCFFISISTLYFCVTRMSVACMQPVRFEWKSPSIICLPNSSWCIRKWYRLSLTFSSIVSNRTKWIRTPLEYTFYHHSLSAVSFMCSVFFLFIFSDLRRVFFLCWMWFLSIRLCPALVVCCHFRIYFFLAILYLSYHLTIYATNIPWYFQPYLVSLGRFYCIFNPAHSWLWFQFVVSLFCPFFFIILFVYSIFWSRLRLWPFENIVTCNGCKIQ